MRHLVLLSLVLGACSPLQERTSYPLEFTAKLPTEPNEQGWSITLEEASVDVGPVRFFEGPVLISSRFSPWDLVVPRALAHPGHYVPGESRGEWRGTASIDLLSDSPTRVGVVDAVTGDVGSMQLTLSSPIVLRGEAVKDGETRAFSVSYELSSALEGVRAEAGITTAPVLARVGIDLSLWLSRVDFSTAVDDDVDGVFTFPSSSQAHNALSRGVANTGAYSVEFVASE